MAENEVGSDRSGVGTKEVPIAALDMIIIATTTTVFCVPQDAER